MYICTYLSVIINLIYFYNHAVGAFLAWWMALFRRTVFQRPTRTRERADVQPSRAAAGCGVGQHGHSAWFQPVLQQSVHTAAPKRPKRILTANVIPPILRDVLQLQASWSLS